MKALVFGSTGGLGTAVCNEFDHQGDTVVAVTRLQLDCSSDDFEQGISKILARETPDYIVNCVGVSGTNQDRYRSVFDANFGSNWAIVQHYLDRLDHAVNITLIGSAVHHQPRQNLMLYAASKTALHNLWQSTENIFSQTTVNIALIHPPRINTPMLGGRPGASLEPAEVAKIVVDLTKSMKHRTLLEMGI
jgi:NAD(P)-dependent dehydrogenase (short-subunit alcohol dehydrogenase family)